MSNGGGNGGGSFDFGSLLDGLLGELAAVVAAIIQFLQDLVVALVNALNFLLAGEDAIFGFSFAGLGDVFGGLKKILDKLLQDVILASMAKLWDFYKKILAWAKKLKAWLDKLHALQKKYEMAYFRKLIQIISRARKILTIFRFFHLKFAQRLDNWLATVEGRAAHYQILLAQKLNEVTAWVNLVVDPRGALRTFPLLAGIIAALDVTWSGIFGTPFSTSFLGTYGRGPTASAQSTVNGIVAGVQSGTGDFGAIAQNWPETQRRFTQEMAGS